MFIIEDKITGEHLGRYDKDPYKWEWVTPEIENVWLEGEYRYILIPEEENAPQKFLWIETAIEAKKHLTEEFLKTESNERVFFEIQEIKNFTAYELQAAKEGQMK